MQFPGRRAGWALPAGLIAGVLLAQSLFSYGWVVWPVVLALLLCFGIRRDLRLAAAIVGLSWATLSLQMHLADRLDPALAGSELSVEGRVEGLPQVYEGFTRFRFRPAAKPGAVRLPRLLLTYWYRDPPTLSAGESWRLQVEINPPWGRINFQGMDREQWLYAEKIGGLAVVHAGERLQAGTGLFAYWNALRQAVRAHLDRSITNQNNRAVVAALAIADRSGLSERQRDTLRQTGTAHLLAISGLHIGLAALCGLWFARVLMLAAPLRWSAGLAYPAMLLTSLALAFVYAALAGFGISTVRALVMLTAGVLALLVRRTIHPGQAVLTALAWILLLDPLAGLSAGFWLSFSAVGVLLLLFGGGGGKNQAWWRQMLRAQVAIMVVLLPLSAWWFQSASVCGLIANLLAIPFVSVLVVPLIFLGLILLPLSHTVSALAFSTAGSAAGFLLEILTLLAKFPLSSLALARPSLWVLILATLGALLLLLPRGLPHRWLGLVLLLPLFAGNRPPHEQRVQMDVLDVGQGTAVLVSSSEHLLLYDSGPGNGEDFDMVDSVIGPAIRHSGHAAPDRILISHADLDHAGGFKRLRKHYPDAAAYASLPFLPAGVEPCNDRLHWNWDDIDFSVLHPSPYLPYIGNDSSCVLALELGSASILLPGDVAAAGEQRLLLHHLANVDILLVPHHGSQSSSTLEFLRATQPRFAIATAGLGNRFGFPRREVQQRYHAAGIPLWSTDACGAIRLLVSADGDIQASSARRSRPAPWRWPAGASCP